MSLISSRRKQVMMTVVAIVGIALAEFFVLEGTFGISLPSDRHSALSTAEIRTQALETHYVTHNFSICKSTSRALQTPRSQSKQ